MEYRTGSKPIYSLAVPETTYQRDKTSSANGSSEKASIDTSNNDKKDEINITEHSLDQEGAQPTLPPKKSYLAELAVWNGVYQTRATTMELLLRPFIACLTPVCLWAALLYGVAITWLVLIATGVAQLFSASRKILFSFVIFHH